MMIKYYIKQAFMLIRQNPFFSGLYLAGTMLSVIMILVATIAYYTKLAPVYPEYNRSRTYYMLSSGAFNKDNAYYWFFSHKALTDLLYPLKNKVAVSGTLREIGSTFFVQSERRAGDIRVIRRLTDPAFFKIYPFTFVAGKPFSEADFSSGLRSAVITDELARLLYGKTDVVGQTFQLNMEEMRVCGVVKSASSLTSVSYAQVYLPYTIIDGYRESVSDMSDYIGQFEATILVKDHAQGKALRREIRDRVKRINSMSTDSTTFEIWNQPMSHATSIFQGYAANKKYSESGTIGHFVLIFLVLLMVPALNLSGMISSRMEERLPEMGVRKSFGANRSSLLSQVIWENFILTLAGGVIGLVLTWIILFAGRGWIFSLFDFSPTDVPPDFSVALSGEMIFAPAIFVAALVLCLIFNVLSALIPAWFSLRKPIVYSLKEKD